MSVSDVLQPLGRGLWALERFGLTPVKLNRRLWNRDEPKVLCVSLPKAGTHLLERALCLHPRLYRRLVPTVTIANLARWNGLQGLLGELRPGQIIVCHLGFRSAYLDAIRTAGVRTVFLIRDPRDLVLSHAHHVMSHKSHELHGLYLRTPEFRDRLRISIEGHPESGFPSIGERLDSFAGWLEGADATIRFEDLVGPAGGGSRDRQLRVLQELYELLGLPADEALVRRIGARVFSSKSPTFRRGVAGEWRTDLEADLRSALYDVAGSHLDRYGYSP